MNEDDVFAGRAALRDGRIVAAKDDPWRGVDYDRRPLRITTAASLANKPVPERDWFVPDFIPAHTVTLLGGDGGTGKSLLALQLAVAATQGGYWAGRQVRHSRCIYLSAEDDIDEMHRRLDDICRADGIGLADLADLVLLPLSGKPAGLAEANVKGGQLKTTDLFQSLRDFLKDDSADLIILDTLADVFLGDENIRSQARQFIGLLRGLCVSYGVTVLVLAHPSVAGMATGSGLSGSTAWNNSVRSRLYFERLKAEDGVADPDIRILRTMKANYAQTGQEVRLRWQAGAFKIAVNGDNGFAATADRSKAERVFLTLVQAYTDEGRYVSPHPNAPTYAPPYFAKDPRAEGIKKLGFTNAMNSLFAAGRIEVSQSDGPPSKRRDIIALKERLLSAAVIDD